MNLTDVITKRYSLVALDPETGAEVAMIHLAPPRLDAKRPTLVTAEEVTIPAGCHLEYRVEDNAYDY